MSFSLEYTDWHLTPRGWEKGTEKIDFGATTEVKPPADRVLTFRFLEEQTSAYSKMHKSSRERWRSTDSAAVDRLLAKFGDAPNSL